MMDEKPFKEVRVMTGKVGMMQIITSAYEAAKFIIEQWPIEEGPKLSYTKHILLKCLEGKISPGTARVAFIEAAKEAGIYIDAPGRPPSTGKLERWGKRRQRVGRSLRRNHLSIIFPHGTICSA